MTSPGASSGRSAASVSGEETKAYTLQAIPPQAFGKYTLIGKLGHGGMAEVLLAVMGGKGGFRKLTVIKRLHPHLEAENGFVDMFLDEARLAAQLDHPNCVQTLEVGEASGQHFLSMEYLDGQGLERLLRSSAQSGFLLPVTVATRIVADALEGLGYAHELQGFDGTPLGVVHRDVSPQNLFVTYNGVVKLLDFGIAKAETNVVETRTGVVKGKYAYIAPEQALAHPVDHRADLWSMGVVLWECLTSRRLFKSVNELATLQETLTASIKRPSEHNPAVPPELDEIAMKALTREVEHRYQSAAEFRTALERWLATQSTTPTRRAISALMKERFEEVQALHKEKLQACLASLEVGPSSIQRLVDGGAPSGQFTPATGTSNQFATSAQMANQFANMTPSSARKISGSPSVTPTPMPVPTSTTTEQLAPAPLPTPQDDPRRALGWKLVVVGAVALAAVAIAIALPSRDDPAIETTTLEAAPPVGTAPPDTAAPDTTVIGATAPDTTVIGATAPDTTVIGATTAGTTAPIDTSTGTTAPLEETTVAAPAPAGTEPE
ncbi:MAG: protein kinase, partial [Myxococcota bacterium]|nr:protein kinase [Myxococcota bacterium]